MAALNLITAPLPAFLAYTLIASGFSLLREGDKGQGFTLLLQGMLCAAGTAGMIAYGLG